MLKKCKQCELIKPIADFSKAGGNKDGRNNSCKPCVVRRNTLYWRTPVGRISYIFNVQKTNSKVREHAAPEYTRAELTEWAFNQGLIELVTAWADSGYSKDLAPSVDRLDDSKGYSFSNIRLVTWQENNEKMYADRKVCNRITRQNRKVQQLDEVGNVLATFDSIAFAARSTGITRININDVCRGKKHCLTAGGFYWRYA